MVDLLKQGATLTEHVCPACSSPIFRLQNGELWCAKCQKRAVLLKEDETVESLKAQAKIDTLENTVLAKIEAVEKKIQDEEDIEELQKLNLLLTTLLENLQKIRAMKKPR
jgi:uncharacterized Zn finger protein (UPF0148 family)